MLLLPVPQLTSPSGSHQSAHCSHTLPPPPCWPCARTCAAAVGGVWCGSAKQLALPDPLTGETFFTVPDTQPSELGPFIASLRAVPKSGLHNPLKAPERYGSLVPTGPAAGPAAGLSAAGPDP